MADHLGGDFVESAFFLVVGAVADQVLAVQLLADALDGVLQAAVAVEAELGAAGALGEYLDRIGLEDRLRVLEDLEQQRHELRAAASPVPKVWMTVLGVAGTPRAAGTWRADGCPGGRVAAARSGSR